MGRLIDITGERFGKCVALEFSHIKKKKHFWGCRCDCGTVWTARKDDLLFGKINSCGCSRGEKHGHSKQGNWSREYRCWSNMRSRCNDPNASGYEHYGGRGIKVCERWNTSFTAFLEDMGEQPSANHSIDRINVEGNYEPSNCRWATLEEQAYNRRNTVKIQLGVKEITLKELSDFSGIPLNIIQSRYYRGWGLGSIILTPPYCYKVGEGN